MRKFYAFILAALMVVGLGAAVHADTTSSGTYGGYQAVQVEEIVPFTSSTVSAVVECPDASWAVTGGGYALENGVSGFVVLANSYTTTSTGIGSWTVAATKTSGSTNIRVRAVCTKLG